MSNLSEINYQKIQDLDYRLEQLKVQLVDTDNTHSEEISNLQDLKANLLADNLTDSHIASWQAKIVPNLTTDLNNKANLDASNLLGENLSSWQLSVARGYTQSKFYLDTITTCGGDYTVTSDGITYCSLTITAPRNGYYLITAIVPAMKGDTHTVKSAIFVDDDWWEVSRSSFHDTHNGSVTATRRIWLTSGTHIVSVRGFANQGVSINVNIPVYSDITMLTVIEQ